MLSAAKAELGAMYTYAHKAVKECIILDAMGHKQPATPVQVNNSKAEGIVNKQVQPKHTKAMDMVSTGCGITASTRNNSNFTGAQAPRTMPIIGQNIIQRHITAT
jgi:hypothetical protein